MKRSSATVAAGVTRFVRDSPEPSSKTTEPSDIPTRVRNPGSVVNPHSSWRLVALGEAPWVDWRSA